MAPGETLSWSARVLAWAGVCMVFGVAAAEAAVEPPRNLRADAPYGERIDLSWEAAGADVEGYRVARRCGGDEVVASVAFWGWARVAARRRFAAGGGGI